MFPINKICNSISKYLSLDESNEEIVKYGLYQGLTLVMNVTTLFIVGIFIGSFYEAFLFLVFLWPLRIFAGGFHANTETKCYILSTLVEIIYFILMKSISVEYVVVFPTEIVFMYIILQMAPQGNRNRTLDLEEEKKYKRKCRKILCIQLFISFLSYLMNKYNIYYVIFLVHALVVVLLTVGHFNNKRIEKYDSKN